MSAHRIWGARKLGARVLVATGALVASGLVLMPASGASAGVVDRLPGSTAGLTDLLATVTPGISGSGSVTGDNGYLCTAGNAAGVASTCADSISLDSLVGLSSVTLVPQPQSGWTFDGWTGCPSITSAGSCLVDSSVIGTVTGTVISPIASFIPILGGGGSGAPAPDTRLSGGPGRNGWLRGDQVRFAVSSDQNGASFACALDGTAVSCGPELLLQQLTAGTHTVTATASLDSQADQTPARQTFTRPLNDVDLTHSRGWRERSGHGYFLGTFSQTRSHGATLKTRAHHIKKIALVATRGIGFGTVKVYLGRQLLRKVSLAGRTLRKRRIIPIARFDHHRRGLVKVVVVSRGKLVRIEGLGLARH